MSSLREPQEIHPMSALVIHIAFHSPTAFTVAVHSKDFIKEVHIN